MNETLYTLTKALSYIEETGQTFSFESNCILNMFVSPSRICAFSNNKLYLKYIKNIIKERGNISFPEKKENYDHYFQDCITLKNLMEKMNSVSEQVFSEDDYLSYTIQLLENLKTPYYNVFSKTLFGLRACFSDREVFEKTLKNFYSVLIRSSDEKMEFIRLISENASFYQDSFQNELLISGILESNLSLFVNEKNFWLTEIMSLLYQTEIFSIDEINQTELLRDFLKKEQQFLWEAEKNSLFTTEEPSLSFYISSRNIWFLNHRNQPPKNVLFRNENYTDIQNQAIHSTFLNTYAYNMTARNYITNPAIGREQEIRDLELILISPKKSPILIGEAGVGKTSVVEGLSYHLQRGQVPKLLKNKKIFKLTTTSLLSGTKYVGEMEERIKQLMTELEKYPDVILFIDEIHTIVGAGSTENSNNDISNMLKPYIDRGDIKIIGSTTIQEYTNYLIPDKALARRFYPITVEEPDENMTLRILMGTIPSIEYETKVKQTFSEENIISIIKEIIQLSHPDNQPKDRYTRLPELPLTLLEMAFSYAALDSRNHLTKQDLIQAVRHSNLLKKEIRQQAEQFFLTCPS